MNKLRELLFLIQNIQVMPEQDRASLAEEIRSTISGDYQMNVGLVDAGIYAPINDALNAIELGDERGFEDNIVKAEEMLEYFNNDQTLGGVIDGLVSEMHTTRGTIVLKEFDKVLSTNAEIKYALSFDAATELVLRRALPGRHFIAITSDFEEYPVSEDCYEHLDLALDELARDGIEAIKELSSEPFREVSID